RSTAAPSPPAARTPLRPACAKARRCSRSASAWSSCGGWCATTRPSGSPTPPASSPRPERTPLERPPQQRVDVFLFPSARRFEVEVALLVRGEGRRVHAPPLAVE